MRPVRMEAQSLMDCTSSNSFEEVRGDRYAPRSWPDPSHPDNPLLCTRSSVLRACV